MIVQPRWLGAALQPFGAGHCRHRARQRAVNRPERKTRLSRVREKRFELGEESFDPMEIGAVTPQIKEAQIKEAGTGRRARLLDAGLVHGQGSMGWCRAEFRPCCICHRERRRIVPYIGLRLRSAEGQNQLAYAGAAVLRCLR